jgi:dipeptidase D
LVSIDGGSLRNAIPRESVAEVAIPTAQQNTFATWITEHQQALSTQYKDTDPNLSVTVAFTAAPATVFEATFQQNVLHTVAHLHNGVYSMSADIEGLVQTSNNVARVLVKDGSFSIQCLTRCSVDAEKMELAHKLQETMGLIQATVTLTGSYPGWTPKPESPIVKLMADVYTELFQSKPHVNACHAGLECGILGTNYPDMEMISFGPNIRGAHSPDEHVQISSVQKYWQYLLETLKRIPQKG